MKNLILPLIFIIAFISNAQNFPDPSPKTWVVDEENILNDELISSKMLDWEHRYKTGVQMAVVTVNSLEDDDVADYAVNLGNKWGVGKKGADNGIIILICSKEHKMNISTGYGLESIITDAQCKEILTSVKPLMKESKYTEAVSNIIDQLHSIIGTMSADERAEWSKNQQIVKERELEKINQSWLNVLLFLLYASIIVTIVILIVKRRMDRKEFNDVKKILENKIQEIYLYLEKNNEKDILKYLIEFRDYSKLKNFKTLEAKTKYINECLETLNIKFKNLTLNIDAKNSFLELNKKIVSQFSGTNHIDAKELITHLPDYIVDISCENTKMFDNFSIINHRYKEICSDIELKHLILNTKIGFADVENLIKNAKSIERELLLTSNKDIEKHLKDAKDCYNIIQNVIVINAIDRQWSSIKNTWKAMNNYIEMCKTTCNVIINTKPRYEQAVKDIANLRNDIDLELIETYKKLTKSGVEIRTKNKFSDLKNKYNKINFSLLLNDVLATIDCVKILNSIIFELSSIKSDAKKEHNNSYNNTSNTYIIGSFSDDNSRTSNDSSISNNDDRYEGGSFGGSGASQDW